MFHDDIKNPSACAETIEKMINQIRETVQYEPFLQFTSHLMMAKHSMALAALHDARELAFKHLGGR